MQCFILWEYCHFPAESNSVNAVFGFTWTVVKPFVLNMYKYILINKYIFLEEGLFRVLLCFHILNKNDSSNFRP